jgi:uncharacterized membrane protein YgcG
MTAIMVLMTAGMILHVTNLTPGSERNPTRRESARLNAQHNKMVEPAVTTRYRSTSKQEEARAGGGGGGGGGDGGGGGGDLRDARDTRVFGRA